LNVFYTFFAATLMRLVAMVPGILSWWINYDFSSYRFFIIKLVLSLLVLLLGIINIALYLNDPMIVDHDSFAGLTYHAIVLFTGFSVIVLGYYGGKITWGNGSKPINSGEKHQANAAAPPLHSMAKESAQILVNDQNVFSILIGGPASSGIDTIEKILPHALKASGYYVCSTKEHMSCVRSGSNTTLIRISDRPINAPVWEVELSIALDTSVLEHMRERYTEKTLVLADVSENRTLPNLLTVPIGERAKALGDRRYTNTYTAGFIFGMLELKLDPLLASIDHYFKEDNENIKAVQEGFKEGGAVEHYTLHELPESDPKRVEALHLMDGASACQTA